MFKVLKELMGAWREGAAEAKAEAELEEAKKLETHATLSAQMQATPAFEQFVMALGAPYRQSFTRELSSAKRDERPAIYLCSFALPPDEKPETWRGLLERDFSITDEASLREVLAGVREVVSVAADASDHATVALWVARVGHIVSAGHAVGMISNKHACELAFPFVLAAMKSFDGWTPYSAAFLQGDSDESNMLSRKLMASSVQALKDSELSPWATVSWPTTPEQIDTLVAWGARAAERDA